MKTTNWQKVFDELARDYDDPLRSADLSFVGFHNRYRFIEATLRRLNLPTGFTLLDCGCGAGYYLRLASQCGARPLGIDFSENMLAHVKKMGFGGSVGNVEHIPFKDALFDVVLNIGILQYLNTVDRSIEEFSRILKPGGFLILVTLSSSSLRVKLLNLRGEDEKNSYSVGELEMGMKKAGLEVVQGQHIYMFPTGLNWLALFLNRHYAINKPLYCLANAVGIVARKS
jgi:ubiquinone/menaquinone biosynthesis C-methylase UbiE